MSELSQNLAGPLYHRTSPGIRGSGLAAAPWVGRAILLWWFFPAASERTLPSSTHLFVLVLWVCLPSAVSCLRSLHLHPSLNQTEMFKMFLHIYLMKLIFPVLNFYIRRLFTISMAFPVHQSINCFCLPMYYNWFFVNFFFFSIQI